MRFLRRIVFRNSLETAMIRNELLQILVCPESHSSVTLASTELIARLNRAIALGLLINRSGQKLERPLSGGLLPESQAIVYPIVDDIPMMLVDEAIPLNQDALGP